MSNKKLDLDQMVYDMDHEEYYEKGNAPVKYKTRTHKEVLYPLAAICLIGAGVYYMSNRFNSINSDQLYEINRIGWL